MTVATGHLDDATLTKTALATTFDPARPPAVPGALRRATLAVGDLLTALAIVLCIPFVILAIGVPIALCVRLLLWIGGLLWGALTEGCESRDARMEMLLLEMFDSLSTELSRLLEARHRSYTSAGTDTDSDAILLDAKIAHLLKTLDRLQVAIGPECVLLH